MRKRTLVLAKRIAIRFLVLVAVCSFLYAFFATALFRIHSYDITGAPEHYVDELKSHLRYLEDHKVAFILPGNRVISYNRSDMHTTILEVLPNTSDIRIYPSGLHTISIKLKQHIPIFSVSDTHAISAEGIVYKEISPVDSYPRLSVTTTTKITSARLKEISELSAKIDAVLFPVKHIQIDDHNDIRLFDMEMKKAIVFGMDISVEKAWSNILSAIDTEPLKSKLKSEMDNLEYLDTRFGNKVFYKFTKEVDTSIIPEQSDAQLTSTTTFQ